MPLTGQSYRRVEKFSQERSVAEEKEGEEEKEKEQKNWESSRLHIPTTSKTPVTRDTAR